MGAANHLLPEEVSVGFTRFTPIIVLLLCTRTPALLQHHLMSRLCTNWLHPARLLGLPMVTSQSSGAPDDVICLCTECMCDCTSQMHFSHPAKHSPGLLNCALIIFALKTLQSPLSCSSSPSSVPAGSGAPAVAYTLLECFRRC